MRTDTRRAMREDRQSTSFIASLGNMADSLCRFQDALGVPGEGVHKVRVPGTDTAAADYVMTLLAAWLISAVFKASLVSVTVALFVAGVVAHRIFCVQIGR